jgi:hypothetical protein
MFHPDKKTAFYQKILETRWLEGINPQMQEKIKIEAKYYICDNRLRAKKYR